jgi:hypothetical protein
MGNFGYSNPQNTDASGGSGTYTQPNGSPGMESQPDYVSKKPGGSEVAYHYNKPTININGAASNPNDTPLVKTRGQSFSNIFGTINNVKKARKKAKKAEKAKSKRSSSSDDGMDEESE